jgi:hypothetical protein
MLAFQEHLTVLWEVSVSKRIRAWVSLPAAVLPTETNFSDAFRSSTVKVTRYFSMAEFLSLERAALFQPHGIASRIARQSQIDTTLDVHFVNPTPVHLSVGKV